MESNNQPSDIKNKPLQVAVLGFTALDEQKLKRAFAIARTNTRQYTFAVNSQAAHSDILIVNYDNPVSLAEKNRLLTLKANIPVVAFSQKPLDDSAVYQLRGVLIAARILNTLDHVELAQPVASSDLFPLEEIKLAPVASKVQAESREVAAETKGYRVLVVDDSPAIQKSLEINLAILPQIGAIDFAENGETALQKVDAQRYDLIFLDVIMPGIDGYETCTQLRKKSVYKKTPIIMVSGKTSPLDEVQGVLAGCTTYLTKPVKEAEFQKLAARVLAWLEKQKKP